MSVEKSPIKPLNKHYVKFKGCLEIMFPIIVLTYHIIIQFLGILSDKNDKDFEYLHILQVIAENYISGVEWIEMPDEEYEYNLVFDRHYEMNVVE